MALNIKDSVAEQLAAEVAQLAGENKTQAVRIALQERKERLELQGGGGRRRRNLRRLLETEIWPLIPDDVRGKRLTKEEEEEILGFGPDGV
jgi:antitoxin VapB